MHAEIVGDSSTFWFMVEAERIAEEWCVVVVVVPTGRDQIYRRSSLRFRLFFHVCRLLFLRAWIPKTLDLELVSRDRTGLPLGKPYSSVLSHPGPARQACQNGEEPDVCEQRESTVCQLNPL